MKTNYKFSQKNRISNFKSLVTIIVFLLFCQNIFAQDVTIPAANTNTTSNNKPLGSFYGYQRTAIIYTAAELGLTANSKIMSFSFYYNSFTTVNGNTPYVIRMVNTTATTFTASTYATEANLAPIVHSGNIQIPSFFPTSGWITNSLTTPLIYTGGNIKVIVETNAGGTGNEQDTAKQFRWSAGASQTWQTDNAPPTGLGVVNTIRPNIQLGFVLAPANDSCSSAFGAEFLPYTNVQTNAENATNNAGFLQCANPMNDGVWYTFFGTGGNMKVAVSGVDATFDPQIDVYSGVCGNLACVGSADVLADGGNETLLFTSVLNTQYFVNVGHFADFLDLPEGNFTIKITDERPSQFNFYSELNYGYEGQSIAVTVNRNSGSNGISSVSYEPNDGSALGNIDYGSAIGTLTWADGDNAPKTITIQLLQDAVIENLETFNLLLTNPTNNATVGFGENVVTIIDRTSPAPNDSCTGALNALTLPYSNVQTRGETSSNNDGFLGCALEGMNDGLWYRVAGNGSNITVAVTNVPTTFNPQLDIYRGSCGLGLLCFQSSDNVTIGGGDSETITFPSVVGTNYFINVGSWSGDFDKPEGNFKIDITSPALANDSFTVVNLKIYPNPFSDILNFETDQEISKISIFNLLGQEVKNINNPATSIDVSDLETGVYLLKLTTAIGEKNVKITKE